MIRGSREFYPANRRVFDDPRSRIVIEDAKTHFAAAGRKYDLIFSELRLRDFEGAASVWEQLESLVRRAAFDLRLELLKSYLDAFKPAQGS